MLTVLEIIKKTTDFLAGKGIESPRLNAELLIGHALGLKRMQLYLQFERPLAETELERIRPLVRRRGQHEPIQYIMGEMEFHGLRLKVDRRALIPRPETEQLVEHVVAACDPPPASVLDLGTGSGAIALALARAFPAATVTAADLSNDALALAGENAFATDLAGRITFIRSDWFAAVPAGPFELIVSNPPYLSAEETARAPLEVRGFEPAQALAAADDGLADLRRIIEGAPRFLAPGGLLALETGMAQHAPLLEIAAAAGLVQAESRRDLAGRDRFILARA
ncbi:MAG: peptide chain release factor N(5)-glutamine methyltransferase [Verrucomicrobia bacterium]|nr:peptide chain release factor N(5)-glutamine methyltransferase [Verrucomicrobiota bacterium]